jgi:hypothetical protein
MGARVVYVCAPARSGSTILARTLGSMDGFLFAGNVRFLWAGISNGHACGCGKSHSECELWSRVLDPGLRFHGLSAEEVAMIQRRAVPSKHSWRGVRRFLRRPLPQPSTPEGRYASLVADLYRRMGEAAGDRVIVDISKNPAEAALLSRRPDISLAVVQVVRDPRATVHSHIRRAVEDPSRRPHPGITAKIAAAWVARETAAQLVREAVGEMGTMVRYEDFIRSPREALERIASLVGVGAGSIPVKGNHAELATAHGPRDRRLRPERVLLNRTESWPEELHPADRALAAALTAPLARRYGYPRPNGPG